MHCRHGGVLICPSLRPDPLGIGHEVRLIPVQHVKPFVQRHKNDSIDAAAIVMAVMHPSTQFVAVKMQDQQAQAMLFRTRELSVTQRVPLTNALPSADRDGTNDAMESYAQKLVTA